jgi:predicted MFS family arabinose efflux permease
MTAAASVSVEHHDDARARRNAVVLAIAFALYSCATINIIISAGIVGTMIAVDKGLATLPISTFVIGTALLTVPASMLMRRIGRRPGFFVGALFGIVSGLIAMLAVYERNFALFAFGTFLQGGYQAFAQYYRFAAADLASPGFRARAISYVLLGGIAGAVVGPLIFMQTKALLAPVLFAGAYLTSSLLSAIAVLVLLFVDIPHQKYTQSTGQARPLARILRQPRLLVAILTGMMSYGMMNLLMTATPIAMHSSGFSVDDSAWVIQWHALAMFAPSFFTGGLVLRFGVERIALAGMGILALAGVAGLVGITFAHFAVGLVLLGLGWNFGFVGGTAMVTECYRPEEKNKVQAVNDFAIFFTVALASIASGKLLDQVGWSAVNWAMFPLVGLCLAGLLWIMALKRKEHRAVKARGDPPLPFDI